MTLDHLNDAAAILRTGSLESETERLNISLSEMRELIDRLAGDLSPVLELEAPIAGDPEMPERAQLAPAVEKILRLDEGTRLMIGVVRGIRSRLMLS